MKILINAIQCARYKEFLISYHRHDYKVCSCGNICDGGRAYLKRGGNFEDIIEFSFYIDDNGTYKTTADERRINAS